MTAALAAAGVTLIAGTEVRDVDLAGRVLGRSGLIAEAERVIALPRLRGPSIAGLPRGEDGFVPADVHGHVPGRQGVYAVGDAAAGLLKHGGIAAQQAEGVAHEIAQRAGALVATPTPRPVVRAQLFEGVVTTFLRAPLSGRMADQHVRRVRRAPLVASAEGRGASTGAGARGERLMSAVAPWHVVIAGGGVAGIEALLGLHSLGDGRLQLALVTPDSRFVVRPYAVAEPFGGPPSPSLPYADIAREQGARFVRDRVLTVHPEDRVVDLEGGRALPYDALVLAVGAQARPWHDAVLTFDGPRAVPAVRRLVGDLTHARAKTVALVVPTGVTWGLPMYELALMLHGRARDRSVMIVTSEPTPLAVFGEEPSRAVGEMLARAGIDVHAGADPHVADDGRAVGLSADGPWLPVDRILAPPVLDGPRLAGVPHDAAGFIPVDEHGRVAGLDRVYAAGDGTDLPVKQGGLAAQQADAAVRHLAAQAGGLLPPSPYRPVLRGRLVTGGLDRYLRHDPGAGDAFLDEPLWEPAEKVMGHYLAPWLAYRHPRPRRRPRHDIERVGVDHELSLEPYGPVR